MTNWPCRGGERLNPAPSNPSRLKSPTAMGTGVEAHELPRLSGIVSSAGSRKRTRAQASWNASGQFTTCREEEEGKKDTAEVDREESEA